MRAVTYELVHQSKDCGARAGILLSLIHIYRKGGKDMDNRLLQVEEGLENRFLYQNDPDSMHILLSMIDHRQKLANLQPGYRLMEQMSKSLNRSLRYRKDRDYIVSAIKKLINDDVNRFELAVFLKGYVA